MTSTASIPVVDRISRENPWPGLRSYDEDEQDFFYGRPREATELLRLVKRGVLTVFFGISGIGKSSLLNAGLFPLLRRDGLLPIRVRLGFAEPNRNLALDVIRAFEAEVTRHSLKMDQSAGPQADGSETLWEYFHRVRVWDHADRLAPVLVFDQFEEVFTVGGAHRAAAGMSAFLAELADLVENHIPESVRRRVDQTRQPLAFGVDQQPYGVLIALREDYLANLEELVPLMPSLSTRNRFRLLPMTPAQALDAVLRPGAGVITEPVARRIVEVIGYTRRSRSGAETIPDEGAGTQREIEPFLLSLVCRELNNRRQERGLPAISADLVQSSQGVDQILSDFYQRCFVGLGPAVRIFVEDQLVGRTGFRQMVALDDVAELPEVKAAIPELVGRRLLRIEEDRQGVARVELTHDVLTPIAVTHRNLRLLEEQTASAMREQRAARRRLLTAVMAALLVLAIGGMSIAVWQWQKQREAAAELVTALEEAESARRSEGQSRADAERKLEAAEAARNSATLALEAIDDLKQGAAATPLAQQRVQQLQDRAQTALAVSSRIERAPLPPPTVSTPQAARGQAVPVRRVYIQVRNERDAQTARQVVIPALQRAGFEVPEPEILSTGPSATEIRYFRPDDRASAEQITELLRRAGLVGGIKQLGGYEQSKTVREGHFEIWLEDDFFFP